MCVWGGGEIQSFHGNEVFIGFIISKIIFFLILQIKEHCGFQWCRDNLRKKKQQTSPKSKNVCSLAVNSKIT